MAKNRQQNIAVVYQNLGITLEMITLTTLLFRNMNECDLASSVNVLAKMERDIFLKASSNHGSR